MRVGIIGSGVVAQALGNGFGKHRHDVMLGTRDPSKLVDWAERNPTARIGDFAATAKFGELVVLAVKGTVAAEALRAAEGYLPGFDKLASRAESSASGRLGWPAPNDPRVAIDEAEYDLALLAPLIDAEPETVAGTANYLLSTNRHLARALRARSRRWRGTMEWKSPRFQGPMYGRPRSTSATATVPGSSAVAIGLPL